MITMPFAAAPVVETAGATRANLADAKAFVPASGRPANIRVVQTSQAGSIDILKILAAFAHGADGVLVAGLGRATETQRQRAVVLRELLHFVGCSRERLALVDDGVDEKVELAFAGRVRKLGPWTFDGNADLRKELAGLPGRHVGGHAPLATSQALRKVAVDLLASGRVEGVLAWGQGLDEIRPTLARTPEQARRLFAGGPGYPNLTTLLEVIAEQNVAVVVRPAELACIAALREDGIPVPEGLFLIGQGVPAGECDVLLPGSSDTAGVQAGDEVAALEGWSMADRAAFWSGQFSNCVQCDGCRSACPFQCYTNCLGEALTPHDGHTPTAAQSACAHLACAVRLAGHCVQCESCSAACPQSVPLYLLHQKAQMVAAGLR